MKLSAKEIAVILGVTERHVRRLALKENWPYTEKPVRGGKKKYYDVYSIPNKETRKKIFKAKNIKEKPEIWEITLRIVVKRLYEETTDEA